VRLSPRSAPLTVVGLLLSVIPHPQRISSTHHDVGEYLGILLQERLIYEYSKITKSKGDIKSWNKKNNKHLLTLKQFLIENLKQSNKSLINNFKNLSNEIEKYNQEIAKEKNAYKDLNKKYPFINTIIKTRGES